MNNNIGTNSIDVIVYTFSYYDVHASGIGPVNLNLNSPMKKNYCNILQNSRDIKKHETIASYSNLFSLSTNSTLTTVVDEI